MGSCIFPFLSPSPLLRAVLGSPVRVRDVGPANILETVTVASTAKVMARMTRTLTDFSSSWKVVQGDDHSRICVFALWIPSGARVMDSILPRNLKIANKRLDVVVKRRPMWFLWSRNDSSVVHELWFESMTEGEV